MRTIPLTVGEFALIAIAVALWIAVIFGFNLS